ncbi:MAG TPA: NADH-quinone oxidoreductase subunit C [Actinomycetota bacterium]|jgi:NADH-quinone oxidoreductase subunit C
MEEATNQPPESAGPAGETAPSVAAAVARFPGVVTQRPSPPGEAVVSVDAAHWAEVARWLHDEAGFEFLSDLCGVHWPHRRPHFEVVCTLTDLRTPARIRVVVGVDEESPALTSVTGIWPGANWFEREAYDMFGIVFEGHPNLTRILMPDEWEGHPLRKDYSVGKVPVEYKHLSPGH